MRALLANTPDNADALNTLALSELALGEFQDAEQHLQEALHKLPNNLSSSEEIAVMRLRRRDFPGAEDVLKKAQAAAPQSADTAVALGQFYILMGRWIEAGAEFQAALRIAAGDPSALLGQAAVETRLGRKEQAEQLYRKLAGLPDKRYQHLHAAYLFAEGQREAGIKEFEKQYKAAPGDRDRRNRLVAAYLVSGRLDAAENVLGAALQTNSKDTDALLQHSQILARLGKNQEAENDLNQVLHFKPDSAEAHYLLAHIYESRGDRRRQNGALSDALRYNPSFLRARVELAQLLALSGSPTGALDALDGAPEAQKRTPAMQLERNLANFAAGDLAAFREGVAQSLRLARTPDALLQDVVIKLSDRDYAGARASLDEVLKQAPDNLRAVEANVYSYTVQNQRKEASKFLIEHAALSKSAAIQEYAGEWLWSEGEHAQARAALSRAKALDAQYMPADLALAQADLTEGKLDQARTTLSRILKADPANFAGQILMAVLETRAENPQAAIEHYRKALEQQPRNPVVLNNLAYLLVEKANQPEEALTHAQQALEVAPGSPDAAGTLGWVFFRKGLYRDALQLLVRAAAQDRDSGERNAIIRKYHLAMTYLEVGDKRKGLEILVRALEQNPNLEEARMAQALFR
jgi:tetratricopeptide (TPR) repeat protein